MSAGTVTLPRDPLADRRARALNDADLALLLARQRFSVAALACMRGLAGADVLVARALQEVDLARAALREAAET
jgi:hypothetical protein